MAILYQVIMIILVNNTQKEHTKKVCGVNVCFSVSPGALQAFVVCCGAGSSFIPRRKIKKKRSHLRDVTLAIKYAHALQMEFNMVLPVSRTMADSSSTYSSSTYSCCQEEQSSLLRHMLCFNTLEYMGEVQSH